MKKYFLAALVAVFGFANHVFAQSSITATLIHDGNISTFYGEGALRNAHSAAKHGDVITLSSGRFTSTDITKAVTLRGAGMEYDSISVTEPTIIAGDFKINIANDSTLQNHIFSMEGIYHHSEITIAGRLNNPQFVKCKLHQISNGKTGGYYDDGLSNAQFIHCIISGTLEVCDGSAALYNCYVQSPNNYLDSGNINAIGTFEFQNCVIRSTHMDYIRRSIIRNSYINATNLNYATLQGSTYAYNCVGNTSTIFKNQITETNTVAGIPSVFKTWNGDGINTFKTERLELTDEAKTKYLGGDGTQIGIYGGNIPFVAHTSNPKITKLNVASKSTADGKLSVDIEVKAAE